MLGVGLMNWVVLSLVAAFSVATGDALRKNALRFYSEYLVAWAVVTIAASFSLATLFFTPLPDLDLAFYIAFGCSLPLEVAAIIFYNKALKASPLSLTLPFLSLTPAFLLVTPVFILGETVKLSGVVGILILTCGAYCLHLSTARADILGPFRAIKREKGSLYMITVAAIYSLTAALGKKAIEHSSASFFLATYVAAQSIMLAGPALLFYKRHHRQSETLDLPRLLRFTILPGVLLFVSLLAHFQAVQLTEVAYMISVKRLSLLIGVAYGWLFFREEDIRERFFGAALMLLGFVIIVLYSL